MLAIYVVYGSGCPHRNTKYFQTNHFFFKLQKNTFLKSRYARQSYFCASQLAKIALCSQRCQLMYDGHHFTTKKWKNGSNSLKKFLLHILERLRENICAAMGQNWRSKLTNKFLAKRIGDTLVVRMILIYKCVPQGGDTCRQEASYLQVCPQLFFWPKICWSIWIVIFVP